MKILSIISLLIITSCTSNYGKFSVISTANVRGLEYDGEKRSEFKSISGESCMHDVEIARTVIGLATVVGFLWDGLQFGEKDLRIERAVDDAIKNGRDQGVFNGDAIESAYVDNKKVGIPFIYTYDCIKVKGNIINSQSKKND
jgi:hypothetical protein